MKIGNRKRKIQSDKIVKELIMYLDLLSSGKVYQSELNLSTFEMEDDFNSTNTEIESPTSLRTFQRYAKDLEEAGAVPRLELRRDPDEGDNPFYNVEKYKTEQASRNYKSSNQSYSFVVKKEDLKQSFADVYLKDYQNFNINHSEAHIARLARICKLANGVCRSLEKRKIKTDKEAKEFLENYYRNNISSDYNSKTFQRDVDVLIIALNEVFNSSASDRYKEVIGKFLRGYQRESIDESYIETQ